MASNPIYRGIPHSSQPLEFKKREKIVTHKVLLLVQTFGVHGLTANQIGAALGHCPLSVEKWMNRNAGKNGISKKRGFYMKIPGKAENTGVESGSPSEPAKPFFTMNVCAGKLCATEHEMPCGPALQFSLIPHGEVDGRLLGKYSLRDLLELVPKLKEWKASFQVAI